MFAGGLAEEDAVRFGTGLNFPKGTPTSDEGGTSGGTGFFDRVGVDVELNPGFTGGDRDCALKKGTIGTGDWPAGLPACGLAFAAAAAAAAHCFCISLAKCIWNGMRERL